MASQEKNKVDDNTCSAHKLPTEDQLQLYLWQKASFLDTGHGPSDKADTLRLQLAQLSYYNKKRYLTSWC